MQEQINNLNNIIQLAFKSFSERPCFSVKMQGRFKNVYYSEIGESVKKYNHILKAGCNLKKGDRLAIVAENSIEWISIYFASLFSGIIPVPINRELPIDMIIRSIDDSGAAVIILDDLRLLSKIHDVSGKLSDLKKIIVMEDFEGDYPNTFTLSSLFEKHNSVKNNKKNLVTTDNINPDQICTILYTYKGSGNPIGCTFTHSQFITTLNRLSEWFNLEESDRGFSLVNWSNFISLFAALNYFKSGVVNVLAENTESVFDNLRETSPSVAMTIPLAFEKIYKRVIDEFNLHTESRRKIFEWALSVSKEYKQAGSNVSEDLARQYARADKTFFSRIRAMTGGNLKRIYSAGASLSREIAEFSEAIGFTVLNIYSYLETGGFPAVSTPESRRMGSCGTIAPGFQIRIADDGEIFVRTDTISESYWNKSAEKKPITDEDGWFHTGDIGRFDHDGFLYLTGHKESIFMLSNGHKITPDKIETLLNSKPMIVKSFVFGEGKPYVSALILANKEFDDNPADVNIYSEDNEGNSAEASGSISEIIDEYISEINKQLNAWEKIQAYSIINNNMINNEQDISFLMKSSRNKILERFQFYVDSMYPKTLKLTEKTVDHVKLAPEQLRDLLEKQDILDAWMKEAGIEFLLDLAAEKNIDTTSMIHICVTVASIAQMQSEEKPLSTAFIVGDPTQVSKILRESEIQLQRYDHVRRMQQVVVSLAKMVDGIVLAYGVDKHGYLYNIYKVDIEVEEPELYFLGPYFRLHASLSKKCNSIVFFAPVGGKQVRVFADGNLIGRYSNGKWTEENIPMLDDTLLKVAEDKTYDLKLLKRIFRCAYQMSESNMGAIFVLGESEKILRNTDALEMSSYAVIINTSLDNLSDRELINYAKQDGATIIDAHTCKFMGCMALLRPSASTKADVGLGKGARHSSAAKMSAEAKCIAITVSQDGPITLYDNGRKLLSL